MRGLLLRAGREKGRGGRRREGRGGLSGNVTEEAFCLKSAPAPNPRYSGGTVAKAPGGSFKLVTPGAQVVQIAARNILHGVAHFPNSGSTLDPPCSSLRHTVVTSEPQAVVAVAVAAADDDSSSSGGIKTVALV